MINSYPTERFKIPFHIPLYGSVSRFYWIGSHHQHNQCLLPQFSHWQLILKTQSVEGDIFSMETKILRGCIFSTCHQHLPHNNVGLVTVIELVTYHLGNKNNKPSCNFKHFKNIHPENTEEEFLKKIWYVFSSYIAFFFYLHLLLGTWVCI